MQSAYLPTWYLPNIDSPITGDFKCINLSIEPKCNKKGQLISKCLFGYYLQSSQKTNENNSTWGTLV